MQTPPTNPALDSLTEYFTDTTSRARAAAPDAPWVDLSIGDPLEPTPPFIRRAMIEAVTPSLPYPTAAGQPDLRRAVAQWMARRHGVEVDPATQVLPSAGSKEAVFHLPLAVLDPGGPRRGVVWGDPGYPVYGRSAVLCGGVSDPVTLTHDQQWRLELSDLPTARLSATSIAWINYPHSPTGATVDLPYLRLQVEVARAHGMVLASDECYQEIWFDEPAPSVLEACDGDLTGVLAFVSLSKRSGMTGYRSGAIVGDEQLIARLRRLRVNIGTASPDFVQAAATAAWADQGHVDERRATFAAKRDVVLAFLAERGFTVSGSGATFYVWFRVPGGDDVAYAQRLLDAHLIITPGSSFGPAGAGWARLALTPTLDGCRRAVAAWGEAIDAGHLPR